MFAFKTSLAPLIPNHPPNTSRNSLPYLPLPLPSALLCIYDIGVMRNKFLDSYRQSELVSVVWLIESLKKSIFSNNLNLLSGLPSSLCTSCRWKVLWATFFEFCNHKLMVLYIASGCETNCTLVFWIVVKVFLLGLYFCIFCNVCWFKLPFLSLIIHSLSWAKPHPVCLLCSSWQSISLSIFR